MSYASRGLNAVGISIPNLDTSLHPSYNTDISAVFPNWNPVPFTGPSSGSGLINPFTNSSSATTPLDPIPTLSAAKSISWEIVAGIAALAWLLTRK